MGLISRVSSRTYRLFYRTMSRELTNRMLNGISDEKLEITKKSRKRTLKALKKNTKEKQLLSIKHTSNIKTALSNPSKKKNKIIQKEILITQKKCLEYLRNDKYKFKPGIGMKKQKETSEQNNSIFTDADFKAWE